MDAFVKGSAGQVLPIRAESYAVDGLLMLRERVGADASLYVPQSHRRIKRSTCQHDVGVWVAGGGPVGAPLDGVDLFIVSLKIVDAHLLFHAPDLQCHVIRAGGQQHSRRIPFDGVDLVCVSLEGFDWAVTAEPAHVDTHVCATGGEGRVVLPVHIKGRGRMKRKLLFGFSCVGIPNYCCFVYTSTQNVIPLSVPFQGKDGAFMLA